MGLSRKGMTILGALLLTGWLSAAGAEAHSIYIFAFPEGTRIYTNSYFGGKAKVRGGQVSMTTVSGEVLATAQTDDQGEACFERPEPVQDLLFIVEASGGHRAEFKLPAVELTGLPENLTGRESSAEQPPATIAASDLSAGCPELLTSDDLHKALSPIMLKLAEMESAQNSSVTLKDIIGGLGWLIGLAGAALWASGRKNSKTREKY